MIAPGGTFDYEIPVEEDKSSPKTRWMGKGQTTRARAYHPGLLGYTPDFELSEGLLTLRSTEPEHIRRTDKHFIEQGILALASHEIGDALAMALRDRDFLYFSRSGSGEYGFSLIRNNILILGMGGIAYLPLGSGIEVIEDPRLRELDIFDDDFVPPGDLRVTVRIQDQSFDLLEGQEVIAGSYHVFVGRDSEVGIPGWGSILSIAQLTGKLTREMVISCTMKFTDAEKMSRWEL
jgi:hypothetical protein